MQRVDGRGPEDMRPIRIVRNYVKYPEGSALMEVGDTRFICTASIEDKVPPFWGNRSREDYREYAVPRATQSERCGSRLAG